jgi:hypothetical protein
MRSENVHHLKPEHEPVAIVWSDQIPDDAIQPGYGIPIPPRRLSPGLP